MLKKQQPQQKSKPQPRPKSRHDSEAGRVVIYAAIALAGTALIALGALFESSSLAYTVLIGLGCSAVTAAIATGLLDLQERTHSRSNLRRLRSNALSDLHRNVVYMLQRVLWFSERIGDEGFDWGLAPRAYSLVPYMLFASQNYPSYSLSAEEAQARLESLAEEYSLEALREMGQPDRSRIERMSLIVIGSSEEAIEVNQALQARRLELDAAGIVACEKLDELAFLFTTALRTMALPGGNVGLGIESLQKLEHELRQLGGFNPSFSVALQGAYKLA